MCEKVLKIVITALLQEFMCDSLDDLLVLCARKGIKITVQVASDIYYNWEWSRRKEIKYTPLNNNHIVVPATSVKDRDKNKYC